MKTIKSLWLLSAILSVLFFSCTKADVTPNDLAVASESNHGHGDDEEGGGNGGGDYGGGGSCGGGGGYTPVDTTGLTFCSPVTVPLCTRAGLTIGSVTVQTGSDRNTYVIFALTGDWYFKTCSLFAGNDNAVPAYSTNFPYQISFNSYTVHSYIFKISGLPSIYTVAANAVALKVVNNRILDGQIVWGDGCSGVSINSSSSSCNNTWGIKFNYTRLNCMLVDICSKPLKTYFDSTFNGLPIAWPATGSITLSLTGAVTVNVAGYSYTESEGRAIYNAMNGNNPAESRTGFIHIAALKLSGTNYSLDPDLNSAVTTVETWLATRGKLSPTNLPACTNVAVKNAIIYIDRWIKMYTCPDRR